MFVDQLTRNKQTSYLTVNISFQFVGPSIPENTSIYQEIHEYEDLNQDKLEKPYENSKVVDKIYVSLKPTVMEKIRNHMQSAVSMSCVKQNDTDS